MRIEWKELHTLGASDLVLDFYSNTSPLDIFKTDDNSYEIRGVIDAIATDGADLLRILEDIAAECAEK